LIQIILITALAIILLLDKQMRGFLTAFLQCRASRGQKIFLQINSMSGMYFKSAKVINGTGLQYKTEGIRGKKQTLVIPEDFDFDTLFGMNTATFDEMTNILWSNKGRVSLQKKEAGTKEGKHFVEFAVKKIEDPTTTDDFFARAVKAPALRNKAVTLNKGLMTIGAIAAIAAAYFAWQINGKVDTILNRQEIIKEALEQLGAVIN
jgi:hypothetical protein